MSIQFNHKGKGSVIGSGAFVFRHFAEESYTITPNLTNVTASESNPTKIQKNGTATLTYTADGVNYLVPFDAPTITGANAEYRRLSHTKCIITLSNPTNNVSFFLRGEYVSPLNYICFEAIEENSTLSLNKIGVPYQNSIQYSYNKSIWNTISYGTDIPLTNVGDKVYFRGNNGKLSKSAQDYYQFSMTGKIAVSGNVMSLIDYNCEITEFTESNTFNSLFYGCSGLVDASRLLLPATTLTFGCYVSMFNGCANLEKAPTLPATTLAEYCYSAMFFGCKKLETAPILPALTLAPHCYNNMFHGTAFEVAPNLPAMTLAEYCYQGMFAYSTLKVAPSILPATTLVTGCYQNMFASCSWIETAPYLPASTLVTGCYQNMFESCKKVEELYLGCSKSTGELNGSPWGAKNATIYYSWNPTV